MTDTAKTPSLNRLMAEINKTAGDTVIGRLADMENVNIERLPSGISRLDEALGGGWPTGRIVELFGLPSAGKSLIAQLAMAEAQKKGQDCIYVDCESSFDPEFARQLGVDPDKVALLQSGIGEDIFDYLCKLLEAKPGVVVIDSVASFVTKVEMEESVGKAEMAGKARLMSKGLRKLNALNQNTLIIFINQLRQSISTWGPAPKVTTGGMALPFYCSIRVEVKKDKEALRVDGKKTTDIIGQIIQFNIVKNKTAAPFKYGSFKFWYDGAKVE